MTQSCCGKSVHARGKAFQWAYAKFEKISDVTVNLGEHLRTIAMPGAGQTASQTHGKMISGNDGIEHLGGSIVLMLLKL